MDGLLTQLTLTKNKTNQQANKRKTSSHRILPSPLVGTESVMWNMCAGMKTIALI